MARLDSASTPMRLGEAAELDGIVQIGTGVTIRTRVPVATYEDMTVAQNREHPYEQYALLSESAMQARIARQAAAYRNAVACCAATDWAARSIVDDYGIQPDKVHVVGIGAHPPVSVDERDWRSPRYLFVGFDWERKNGPAVIRAFERLRAEHPDARLDVVGRHPPLEVEGVTGHGVLRRDQPDERQIVNELFSGATCFVMPSHLEAAGIVYVEAAAAGIPVIGTTVGGCSWLIGAGGVTVEPSSDSAILDAMRRFADPELAARTGRLGRERSRRFTWTTVAQGLLDALAGRAGRDLVDLHTTPPASDPPSRATDHPLGDS